MGSVAGRHGEDLVRCLGEDRARGVLAELAAHDLVIVSTGELEELEREAAGYRRLAALVDDDA